jgi:hypothetical protein
MSLLVNHTLDCRIFAARSALHCEELVAQIHIQKPHAAAAPLAVMQLLMLLDKRFIPTEVKIQI